MQAFSFATTPRLLVQRGGSAHLGEQARRMGASRVFLVSDAGLMRAGVVEPALASLRAAGIDVTVYADVQADPPETVVLAAAQLARDAGSDLVVGLGGGSSLDTAKLVALLAGGSESLEAIYGVDLARGPRLPLVLVPTTAGTGSEVTPISIVTTPTHEKKGVVTPLLYPDLALLDAELTLGLPPAVTAMTGVDAMVHAIEAYTGRLKKNPLSDAFALDALKRLFHHIDRVVQTGADIEAREQMLLGSCMAGIAFANSPVGAVHALAYPLGGHHHVPHGLSNSLVLAPVLRFNLEAARAHYAELGRAVLGPAASAEDFVAAIEALVARMPYAQTLREVGVSEPELALLAEDALKVQRLLVNNPREVQPADALALYREAF
ncbi:iron-containing alcohol dehydrogenase [Burkholderiaceae bacterium UC74_6]